MRASTSTNPLKDEVKVGKLNRNNSATVGENVLAGRPEEILIQASNHELSAQNSNSNFVVLARVHAREECSETILFTPQRPQPFQFQTTKSHLKTKLDSTSRIAICHSHLIMQISHHLHLINEAILEEATEDHDRQPWRPRQPNTKSRG